MQNTQLKTLANINKAITDAQIVPVLCHDIKIKILLETEDRLLKNMSIPTREAQDITMRAKADQEALRSLLDEDDSIDTDYRDRMIAEQFHRDNAEQIAAVMESELAAKLKPATGFFQSFRDAISKLTSEANSHTPAHREALLKARDEKENELLVREQNIEHARRVIARYRLEPTPIIYSEFVGALSAFDFVFTF